MPELACHTLIIGAGPGGYVCAIRCGQLGLDTILVEAGNEGGTCLNVGCIPSKAIIHAADVFAGASEFALGSVLGIKQAKPKLQLSQTQKWKDGIVERLTGGVRGLLKKNRVRTIKGWAEFVDGKTVVVRSGNETVRISAKCVVIATGSLPAPLPDLPFGNGILSSTDLLSLKSLPESLGVIGAGYIGLELGMAFAKLGCRVELIESAEAILPRYDADLVKPVVARLADLGVAIHTGARATGFDPAHRELKLKARDGREFSVQAEKVLVTIGRKPLIDGWGRENLALDMDGPFIRVNERCETSMRDIFAIGDVTGEPMLAHRAMAQGELVARVVAGQKVDWDKRAIPAVCFTDPEIVVVGQLPLEAADAGIKTKVSKFPFLANGRAMTVERDDGFIRIVSRADNDLILGMQAVGHGVSELSASFSLALEMGATLKDIAGTIHAHPTMSEAIQETALVGLGHAVHI